MAPLLCSSNDLCVDPNGGTNCGPLDLSQSVSRDLAVGAPNTTVVPPGPTGDISGAIYEAGAASFGWNFQGLFTTLTGGGYTQTVTQYGPCEFASFTGSPAVTTNVSAGTLTQLHGAVTDTATPDAQLNYNKGGSSGAAPYYLPGTTVHFAASGGTIPGFAVDVLALDVLTVTSPPPTLPGKSIAIDTKVDLPVAFSGTSEGDLVLSIFGGDALTSVKCKFSGKMPGSYVVPAAALSGLGAGMGSFFIQQRNEKVVNAGTLPVTAALTRNPLQTNGMEYGGSVLATITK